MLRSWNFLNHGEERINPILRHPEQGPVNSSLRVDKQSQMCDSTDKNCSRFTGYCSLKIKAAFTLAEVLITLGIIGVVAALTLPTLINRNEEKVTVNKLKKFYSTMNQAYLMSVNDNGYANEWHVNDGQTEVTANQLAPYIIPYLKVLKDCGTQSGCFGYSQGIKLLNGNDYSSNNFYTASYYYKLILADGSYMFFSAENGEYCKKALGGGYTDVCGEVILDIDGPKGHNTAGRDIFKFYITPKGFMYPNTSDSCSKTDTGWYCANYILTHDNMDYLH